MMTNSSDCDSPIMAISGRVEVRPSDYLEIHSPTGSSEDSVEVKIGPITVNRNKRKSVEPCKKVPDFLNGPLKKRVCYKVKSEIQDYELSNQRHPFRPWSPKSPQIFYNSSNSDPSEQDQPVALIKKKTDNSDSDSVTLPISTTTPRVPIHPSITTMGNIQETDKIILNSSQVFPALNRRGEQRNYKNMTRERRIEANARERTRVHTISAAFDTLRKSIPSYSHNQKLSKLSVLRIACSYIRTLSNIISGDEDALPDSVDLVTKTIQREGKLRKKKDDND